MKSYQWENIWRQCVVMKSNERISHMRASAVKCLCSARRERNAARVVISMATRSSLRAKNDGEVIDMKNNRSAYRGKRQQKIKEEAAAISNASLNKQSRTRCASWRVASRIWRIALSARSPWWAR